MDRMSGEGRTCSSQRAEQGFKPKCPGSQPPGHANGHLAVLAISLSPKPSSLHCTSLLMLEGDSLWVEKRRLAKFNFFLYIPQSWRGPQGSTSTTRALQPHRPPPIQPSAGLLIFHPVPPAPSCLSWGGLRPGTTPERLNQNKS